MLTNIDYQVLEQSVKTYRQLKEQSDKIEKELKKIRTIFTSMIKKNNNEPILIEIDDTRYKISMKEFVKESADDKLLRENFSEIWNQVKKEIPISYPEVRKLKKKEG